MMESRRLPPSTRPCRPAAAAAPSARPPADGGCICGAARRAATSAVATIRCRGTPGSTGQNSGHPNHPILRTGRKLVLGLPEQRLLRGSCLVHQIAAPRTRRPPGPRGRVPRNWARPAAPTRGLIVVNLESFISGVTGGGGGMGLATAGIVGRDHELVLCDIRAGPTRRRGRRAERAGHRLRRRSTLTSLTDVPVDRALRRRRRALGRDRLGHPHRRGQPQHGRGRLRDAHQRRWDA